MTSRILIYKTQDAPYMLQALTEHFIFTSIKRGIIFKMQRKNMFSLDGLKRKCAKYTQSAP